jgi:hypothetical protein
MAIALVEGEYAGVLADGLEDPDTDTRAQAMRAVAAFSSSISDATPTSLLAASVASLAAETLARDRSRRVRLEALHALARPSNGLPHDASCVRALAREIRRGGVNGEAALRAIGATPVRDISAFCAAARCVEGEIVSARAAARTGQGGSGHMDEERYVDFVEDALRRLVKQNWAFAHVADLTRPPSAKLCLLV